jgi:hypothetical protein
VLEDTASALTGHGAAMMGVMVSPLRGADGNVEFLVHLRAHTAPATGASLVEGWIDVALAEVAP